MNSHHNSLIFFVNNYRKIPFIQEILLLIEYAPLLFLSLSCPNKLFCVFFHEDLTQTPSVLFNLSLPYLISTRLSIFISILCLFIVQLLYSIMVSCVINREYSRSCWLSCIFLVFSIFYDLFFFRMGSYYIISLHCHLYISILNQSISAIEIVITIVTFLNMLWYMMQSMVHLQKICVMFHLNNKEVSHGVLNYPYDWNFSRMYDTNMVVLKFLISLENAYSNIMTDRNPYVMILLNGLITIFIIGYFFYLLLYTVIYYRLEWFLFNREMIFYRIGFMLWLGYTLILIILFLNKDSTDEMIAIIIVIGFIWAISTASIIWRCRVLRMLYDGQISYRKLLLAIMGIHHSFLVQIDKERLLYSLDLNYLLHIPQNIPKKTVSITKRSTFFITTAPNQQQQQKEHDHKKSLLSQIFAIFKRFNKKLKPNIDYIDQIYCDVMKLLHYYSKGKLFKYFSYYNSFLKKYQNQPIVVNNIDLLIRISLSSIDDSISFYSDILLDTSLNKSIKQILDSLSIVLNSPKELVKPIGFFKLAESITQLKKDSKYLVTNININDDKIHHDQSLKNIKQIYKYFLIIHRYIVESITNESLCNASPFDIEAMEDYLSSHYSNDKTLLLSLNLNTLSLNKEFLPCTILECGKDIIRHKNKNIASLFPKQFKKECVKGFSSKLMKYIEKKMTTSTAIGNNDHHNSIHNNIFEGIINSSCLYNVELFKYNFHIIPSIINNDVIINGLYSTNEELIMIFKMIGKDELILESFSSILNATFIITPEWIQYAKSINVYLTMQCLFSQIIKVNPEEYEVYFSYSQLLSFLSTHNYQENDSMLLSKEKLTDIKERIKAVNEVKVKPLHFHLRLLFEIESKSTYKVFSIIGTKALAKIMQTQYSIDQHQGNDYNYYDLHHLMGTTNSSMSSSVNPSTSKSGKFRNRTDEKDSYVNKITRTFGKFSNIILLFNSIMIGLCLVFLIIQIIQSQKMLSINKLYYKFQTVRITFANTFLNVFSNVCVANINTAYCRNGYRDYSLKLHELQNLHPKHSINALIVNAIKYKINGLQTQYNSYKEGIDKFGNKELEKISETKMRYVLIGQAKDEIIQEVISITLEEGLKRFINSLAILDQAPNKFDSEAYPIHIITLKDQNLDFTNVHDKNLNDVQREIYKVCINFINYNSGFSLGEELLREEFNITENSTKMILFAYISLIIIFHVILAGLCRWITIIVEKLLVSFLLQIVSMINKKDIKEYIIVKIESLKILNELYTKNPNTLIKNIIKGKKDVLKAILEKKTSKNNKNNQIEDGDENNENEEHNLMNTKIEMSNPDKKEVAKIIVPIIIQIYVLFIMFFVFIIILDIFLLDIFTNVDLINKYVLAHVNFENQLYNNVALPQVTTLLNLTQDELAKGMGINHTDPDGVLNMKIRDAVKYQEEFFRYEKTYPTLFSPLSSYFDNQCEPIFEKTRDKITTLLGELLGVDYIPFQIEMCYRYSSLSLPNFEFSYIDHYFRCHKLQDYMSSSTYEELYNFNQRFEFFDLYTHTLIAVRPIRAYITENILYKSIDTALNDFVSMVTGYLFFNVIADVFIFVMIKIFILQKMNRMHLNLLDFSKCFKVE